MQQYRQRLLCMKCSASADIVEKQKMVVSADIVEKKREMFYNADIINTLETYSSKNEKGM